MDVGVALELQRRALEAWIRALGSGSAGARSLEMAGVTAAVVPAVPAHSIVNCVTYRDAGALGDALPALAAAYEEAGVRKWTVWTPEHEREAIAILEEAGHVFDGAPEAMHLDLAELDAEPADALDWDAAADPAEVGRVNDVAYGLDAGKGPGIAVGASSAEARMRLYRARVDGDVGCVLQTIDVGDDCFVAFVATLPEQRGRGLASKLLAEALRNARDRGLRTSSLQSSRLGRGVYERLGYRVACRLHLYERRR